MTVLSVEVEAWFWLDSESMATPDAIEAITVPSEVMPETETV